MPANSALVRPEESVVHELPGLEVDNLLAILALLGLLQSLEEDKQDWQPRASWAGAPWIARLHLAASATQQQVAEAAARGVKRIASQFDVDSRKNVDFERQEFRSFAERCRTAPVQAALASALTAEHPQKKSGGLRAAPLVLMFGQGHQNFLERLVAVSLGRGHVGREKSKSSADFSDPRYIAEALFRPWRRVDPTEAFRWDPEEDQRYALRFGDPSKAGAAKTVHGANRLAAVGLLSFPCAPGARELNVPGATRDDGVVFVWPVWTEPLSLQAVRRLMSHPGLFGSARRDLPSLGVAEVYGARRVSNGKFMNVTRGVPRRQP